MIPKYNLDKIAFEAVWLKISTEILMMIPCHTYAEITIKNCILF